MEVFSLLILCVLEKKAGNKKSCCETEVLVAVCMLIKYFSFLFVFSILRAEVFFSGFALGNYTNP